jgi:hypothetical protein
MNYLIFDTETTGTPKNYKAPMKDIENWPRVIQLACAKCFFELKRLGIIK